VSFANDSMQDMVYQFLVDQNGEWQYFTLHISIATCIPVYN
jgi:hypothetical protein